MNKLCSKNRYENRKRLTDRTYGCQRGRGWLEVWESHAHIAVFKIGNEQGPTV